MSAHGYAYAALLRRLRGPAALVLLLQGDIPSTLGPGVESLRVPAPRTHFEAAGYVQMVPPLRLPARSPNHRVEVWLRMPEGATITTLQRGKRWLLQLPAGASAARVERIRPNSNLPYDVADVRGTHFTPEGEQFFVLRPESRSPGAALEGWSWPRGVAAAQAAVTDAVAALVSRSAGPRSRVEEVRGVRINNQCAGCHQYARPENRTPRQYGIANRATDASGCYQIQGILEDRVPLETYFPLEQNLDDPFVSFDCGSEPALVDRGKRQVACADGGIPRGTFATQRALKQGDAHAQRLCQSRRFLYDRLDDRGRSVFRAGFSACGLGVEE